LIGVESMTDEYRERKTEREREGRIRKGGR
jgi:hypothetical protein